MTVYKVVLNSSGMRDLLTSSAVASAVESAAEAVADAARSAPEVQRRRMPVATSSRIRPNRAATVVAIAHAGGDGAQAKHGTLTRAVSAAGLRMGRA